VTSTFGTPAKAGHGDSSKLRVRVKILGLEQFVWGGGWWYLSSGQGLS